MGVSPRGPAECRGLQRGPGHRAGGPGRALIAAHCGLSDPHGQGLRRFLEVHSHPASLPMVGGRRRLGRPGEPRPPRLRSQHLPGSRPGARLLYSLLLPFVSVTFPLTQWLPHLGTYVCSSPEEVLTRFPRASPTQVLIPGTWWDPWAHIYNKPTAPQRTTLSVTLARTPSKHEEP